MREYKGMYKNEQYKRHSRVYKRKTREAHRGPGRMRLWTVCWRSTLPLRHSDQQLGESTRSMLQNLDMRIQRSQNSPASGDAKARWRVRISTCVSINLDHKHENRVVGTSMQEQVDIQQLISSRELLMV